MACGGYLEYDAGGRRFTLPPEHAMVLAQEMGPMFLCGLHQELVGFVDVLDPLVEAFKHGGGVPQEAYRQETWDGMERGTATWFENMLVPEWIAAMPDIPAKLERGA